MTFVDFHICHAIPAVGCVCYSCTLCFHLFFCGGGLFFKWKLDHLSCYLLEFQWGGMWPFLVHWQVQSCYKISYFVVTTDSRPCLSLMLLNSRRTIWGIKGKSDLMRLCSVTAMERAEGTDSWRWSARTCIQISLVSPPPIIIRAVFNRVLVEC